MNENDINPKITRKAKDSVFCDLFSQKRYLLELYRAIHPEDESVEEGDLEIVTLERVITTGEYNDVGFTVGRKLLVLVEAQTTWSVNIVTRMLLYLAETFRRDLFKRSVSLHQVAPVEMPTPELYVIYTGKRDAPDKISFKHDVPGGKGGFIDAEVRVLCGLDDDVIGQYAAFTDVVDKIRADESIPTWEKARAVVQRCIERGILDEYMEERHAEVEGIMFTLFDQERETELYHRQLKKECREEGLNEGRKEGRKEGRREGLKEGRKEGLIEGRAADVAQLATSLDIPIERAMELLAVSEEEKERVISLIGQF